MATRLVLVLLNLGHGPVSGMDAAHERRHESISERAFTSAGGDQGSDELPVAVGRRGCGLRPAARGAFAGMGIPENVRALRSPSSSVHSLSRRRSDYVGQSTEALEGLAPGLVDYPHPAAHPAPAAAAATKGTRYTNAALQCLSATLPFAQFFAGPGPGVLSGAFAKLVERGHYHTMDFRKAVRRLNTQFNGSAQHDSQELLNGFARWVFPVLILRVEIMSSLGRDSKTCIKRVVKVLVGSALFISSRDSRSSSQHLSRCPPIGLSISQSIGPGFLTFKTPFSAPYLKRISMLYLLVLFIYSDMF
ncbi:hypothetical protein K438DRAFT_2180392 [Mycena galopus ATCC 62051]|nr:hypothetical protein K438DRAFT_2180392 [Mycena galopus ATCC 62051]